MALNYVNTQQFQDILQRLPAEDRRILEPRLAEFLQSEDAITMEYGTEEVAAMSRVNGFLGEEFGNMDSLWEMPNQGPDVFYIHVLETALADVNQAFGYDPYGLPRLLYTQWEEFRELLKKAPPHFEENVFATFSRNDPTDTEFMLRRDGYLDGLTFIAWALGALPDADRDLQDLIEELGEAIEAINKKVAKARSEAFRKGQIPFEDGKRPTPIGWQ